MNRLLGLLVVGCACSCDDIDDALDRRHEADDAGADGGMATDGGGGGGGAVLDGGICLNGFCWENPLPQGNRLNAVFGADAGEVWMVGEVGTVLRWTPAGWRSYQAAFPVTETLRSVWAKGGDVWAVGTVDTVSAVNPTVMKPRHFDGGSWGEDVWPGPLPAELYSVRGNGLGEVWASGNDGVIARRNPTTGTWSPRSFELALGMSVNLTAIALDDQGNCLVALGDGVRGVAPCDGGPLELVLDASVAPNINALWPTANGFRLGTSQEIRGRSEGQLWLRSPDGGWGQEYQSEVGYTCSAGFANASLSLAYCERGQLLEGSAPTNNGMSLEASTFLTGLWTPGTLEGSWLVGESGAQYRHDGIEWQLLRSGSVETIFSLWVDDQRVLGAGGNSGAYQRQADFSWSVQRLVNGQGETRDLWVSPDGDYRVYVGVARMLIEAQGGTEPVQAQGVDVTGPGPTQLNGVWGTSSADVWAVGEGGQLWQRTASGWSRSTLFPEDAGPELRDIDGNDAGAFVVGDDCTVLRRDDSADGGWVNARPQGCTEPLFGVWVPPANDAGLQAMVVGPGSKAWSLKNGSWGQSNPGVAGSLFKVWGTSPTNIFAVGDNGTLVRFNGNTWSRIETGTRGILESVRGRVVGNQLELFIAGQNGTVLRRLAPL